MIPERNIGVHRHIYEVIKSFDLKHPPGNQDASIFFQRTWWKKRRPIKNYWKSPWGKIDRGLIELQRTGDLTSDNLQLIKKAINVELNSNDKKWAIREIECTMDHRLGKKKKGGPTTDWALNYLLYALVADAHIHNGRPCFQAVANYLSKEELGKFEYENLRKRYKTVNYHKIIILAEMSYNLAKKFGIDFFPKGIKIRSLPVDFLAQVAHETGFKINRYLSHLSASGDYISGKPYRK